MKNYNKENLAGLIRYFEEGCKTDGIQKLGLEVEHFIVEHSTGKSVSYYGPGGVACILEKLKEYYPHAYYEDGYLLGLYSRDFSLSLEPAAQLEISINPRQDIFRIRELYQRFLDQMEPVLHAYGYRLETRGYQPVSRAEELRLIPKVRYECMDDYFRHTGNCGMLMMRGTASAQISIDYFSEEDFIRKMRAACVLGPAVKLLTDNTAVFQGSRTRKHLIRTSIWRDVDPARCGIFPGLFEKCFGFRAYAEYLMDLPLIFLPGNEGADKYVRSRTARDLWKERIMTREDMEHILSMAFLDVRLKQYLELRGADSMPFPYVCCYLALVKGIFGSQEAIGEILEDGLETGQIRTAEDSLMEDGFQGRIYGRPAQEYCRGVVELAKAHLSPDERNLLLPWEKMIEEKRTLAEQYGED